MTVRAKGCSPENLVFAEKQTEQSEGITDQQHAVQEGAQIVGFVNGREIGGDKRPWQFQHENEQQAGQASEQGPSSTQPATAQRALVTGFSSSFVRRLIRDMSFPAAAFGGSYE